MNVSKVLSCYASFFQYVFLTQLISIYSSTVGWLGTSISTECQNIMQMHRLKIGATMWKEEMRYSIIPRTLSLIESLPVLAKSGREIELQANMKLITGYLYISYNQNCLDKTEIKFLASKILENPIRQSLAGKYTCYAV